jgi:hypothetical protein
VLNWEFSTALLISKWPNISPCLIQKISQAEIFTLSKVCIHELILLFSGCKSKREDRHRGQGKVTTKANRTRTKYLTPFFLSLVTDINKFIDNTLDPFYREAPLLRK